MELKDVYIVGTGTYLPNDPVNNKEMEDVLGKIAGEESRNKRLVLRANKIKSRHYALKDGKQTHLNEELAANAVNNALLDANLTNNDIDMLAVGTSIPDLIVPGIASMVHGRVGGRNMEIATSHGVCTSGITAFKNAYNAIKVGDHRRAVVAGSECPSPLFRAERFKKESEFAETRENTAGSYQFFNADFLRWMLSDGAGATVLSSEPRSDNRPSLKVEWVTMKSYANELPTCMYMGTNNPADNQAGSTWASHDSVADAEQAGKLLLRQDTKLLKENILRIVVQDMEMLHDKGMFKADEITHYLPHISSYFFDDLLQQELDGKACNISRDKWFTNLATKGNTGAASIFIMLDEALKTGLFNKGDKILLMIPESGRFAVSHALLTCM